jgi:hypothetical protein
MTSEPNGVIDSWTLPWPEIRVPPYRTGHVGEWELKRQRQSVLRGYFRGLQTCTENYLLMRDNRVWMSLSPVEIESLAPHVAQMRGHVVIAGLGIGLALSNALLRPPVRRVTVLECDNEVIRTVRLDFRLRLEQIGPIQLSNRSTPANGGQPPRLIFSTPISGTRSALRKRLRKFGRLGSPQQCRRLDRAGQYRGQRPAR